jgi:hypothetical protein
MLEDLANGLGKLDGRVLSLALRVCLLDGQRG